MLIPAAVPGDVITAIAALFLLFGVPAVLFGLIMLYTGYVRHDAEQYIETLETDAAASENGPDVEADEPESADESRTDITESEPENTSHSAEGGRSPTMDTDQGER